MVMNLDELFYGPTEATYVVSRSWHSPTYSDVGYKEVTSSQQQPFHHSAGGGGVVLVVPPSSTTGTTLVELMVPNMCCSKCEEKVREALLELNGVEAVICDPLTQRVTVQSGRFVDPMRALKKVRKVKKHAQLLTSAAADQQLAGHDQYPAPAAAIPSKYRTSYSELYTPSAYISENNSYMQYWPTTYGDGYSNVVTNPHYFKHIQTEY